MSSGPREKTVELHIRGLGDHTNKLVALSKKNSYCYVRMDGPYGNHKLSYRRYPVLLLAGGGVGITPVMGIIKDIYNVGDLADFDRTDIPPHCIEGIYVLWVMRSPDIYHWFRQEIIDCVTKANAANSPYPPLYVWCYVTSVTECESPDGEDICELTPGRPNMDIIFADIVEHHKGKSSVVFACGPEAMVCVVCLFLFCRVFVFVITLRVNGAAYLILTRIPSLLLHIWLTGQ